MPYAATVFTSVAATLFVGASSAATEGKSLCPKKLTVVQTTSGTVGDGWESIGSNKEHPFEGVSFSSGHPREAMILAPTKEIKKGKSIAVVWEFGESNEAYWVSCEYAKTSATVAKSLDTEIVWCRVEYDNSFSTPVVMKWECGELGQKPAIKR